MKMNIQNPRKNSMLEEMDDDVQINSMQPNQNLNFNQNLNQANQKNSFAQQKFGFNNLSARATMIMNKSKKMNASKKRNMDDYMSQGLLEVEKVMNNSQHFQSIPDDHIGQT